MSACRRGGRTLGCAHDPCTLAISVAEAEGFSRAAGQCPPFCETTTVSGLDEILWPAMSTKDEEIGVVFRLSTSSIVLVINIKMI